MIILLDLLMFVLLIYLAYSGYKRGALGEVISFISVFAGFFVGIRFYEQFSFVIPTSLESIWIREAISFLALFLMVVVGLHLVGRFITKVLKLTFLGAANHVFGLVIGTTKGFVAIFFLATVVLIIFPSSKAKLAQSNVISRVVIVSDALAGVVPQRVQDHLQDLKGAAFTSVFNKSKIIPCSHCGTFATDKDNYCSYCGSSMKVRKICLQCLLPLTESVENCPKCAIPGIDIDDSRFEKILNYYKIISDSALSLHFDKGIIVEFDRNTLHGRIVNQNYDSVSILPASFFSLAVAASHLVGDSVSFTTRSFYGKSSVAFHVEKF